MCRLSHLRCHDLALEAIPWHRQLQLLTRSRALVAYHGAGVGAGLFWLPPRAVVLEFMPKGCWWCVFARAAENRSISWFISTDAVPSSPVGCETEATCENM